jgi:hypothetical protein
MVGPESQVNAAPDTLMIQIPEEEISEDYNETIQLEYEGSQHVNLTPTPSPKGRGECGGTLGIK